MDPLSENIPKSEKNERKHSTIDEVDESNQEETVNTKQQENDENSSKTTEIMTQQSENESIAPSLNSNNNSVTSVSSKNNSVTTSRVNSIIRSTSVKEIITPKEITTWNCIPPRVSADAPGAIGFGEKIHPSCPFPANESINSRVALFYGDITSLAVDAIVNTTNESFSDQTALPRRIFSAAGPQLKQYIRDHVKTCRTGDAKISPAYYLPAKYIIHSVGPKYNERYRTAAEGALYSAYNRVLQLARENKIRTLALCAINCIRRGYPPQAGAHMALRVVRRVLEKYEEYFSLIIFVVEDVDIGIYDHLMPFYFPRSPAEEESAQYYLPKDIGGDNGQPVLPERDIRISIKPTAAALAELHGTQVEEIVEQSVDLTSGLNSSVAVGKSSFARMQPDIDKRWKNVSHRTNSDQLTHLASRRSRYERILRMVHCQNFKYFEDLKFLYTPFTNDSGPMIVVIIGNRLPFSSLDEDLLLQYIVYKMEKIVTRSYTVIYFNSLTTPDNHPCMMWINNLFDTLPEEYLLNLTSFFIVHSNFWVKLYTWWFTTFNEGSLIKHKIIHLGGIQYLHDIVPGINSLALPSDILEYDRKASYHS